MLILPFYDSTKASQSSQHMGLVTIGHRLFLLWPLADSFVPTWGDQTPFMPPSDAGIWSHANSPCRSQLPPMYLTGTVFHDSRETGIHFVSQLISFLIDAPRWDTCLGHSCYESKICVQFLTLGGNWMERANANPVLCCALSLNQLWRRRLSEALMNAQTNCFPIKPTKNHPLEI